MPVPPALPGNRDSGCHLELALRRQHPNDSVPCSVRCPARQHRRREFLAPRQRAGPTLVGRAVLSDGGGLLRERRDAWEAGSALSHRHLGRRAYLGRWPEGAAREPRRDLLSERRSVLRDRWAVRIGADDRRRRHLATRARLEEARRGTAALCHPVRDAEPLCRPGRGRRAAAAWQRLPLDGAVRRLHDRRRQELASRSCKTTTRR